MPSAFRPVEADCVPAFNLCEANQTTRAALEAFIARRFAEVYGARLYSFMPRLFGLQAPNGDLIAAFGLRAAGQQALFLERYLDAPIEAYVAERHGGPVPRRRIVEVGNLAGAAAGAVRQIIVLLCERLHAEGFHWATFTGSARMCNSFAHLGLPLGVIAPAPVERLCASERAHWGRYYEKSPSVMLGNIDSGRRLLRDNLASTRARDPLAPLAFVGAP